MKRIRKQFFSTLMTLLLCLSLLPIQAFAAQNGNGFETNGAAVNEGTESEIVGESETDSGAILETETSTETIIETEIETEAEKEVETEQETEIETEAEADTEVETEMETEAVTETEMEVETDTSLLDPDNGKKLMKGLLKSPASNTSGKDKGTYTFILRREGDT